MSEVVHRLHQERQTQLQSTIITKQLKQNQNSDIVV